MLKKINIKLQSIIQNIIDSLPSILEIAFSLGVFYFSAKIITLIFKYDKISVIPPDFTTYEILISNNTIYIIPAIVLLVLMILITVFFMKGKVIYMVKAFILDLVLTILSVKFSTSYNIASIKNMDWLLVLALMLTWALPLILAAFAEYRQKYALLRNLLLFIGFAFVIFLPSLVQDKFARSQIFSTIIGALTIYIVISYVISLTYAIKIDTEKDSSIGTAFFVNAILPLFLLLLIGVGLFSIFLIILKLPVHIFSHSSIGYIKLSQTNVFKLGLLPIYIVFDYSKDFFEFHTFSQFISSIAFLSSIFVVLLNSPKSTSDLISENVNPFRMIIGALFILLYIMGFQSILSSIIRVIIAAVLIVILYIYHKLILSKIPTHQ